jgi:hypothetical protein
LVVHPFKKPVLIATHAAGTMDELKIGFVTGGIEKICLMMTVRRSAWAGIDRKNEILGSVPAILPQFAAHQ